MLKKKKKSLRRWESFYLTAAEQTDGQAGWQSDRHHMTRQKTGNTDRLTQTEEQQERERDKEKTHRETD